MKKMLFIAAACQLWVSTQHDAVPMKHALNLLTDQIWIEKLNYKVYGVVFLTDLGGLRLMGYDLYENYPDSVYVDGFAVK